MKKRIISAGLFIFVLLLMGCPFEPEASTAGTSQADPVSSRTLSLGRDAITMYKGQQVQLICIVIPAIQNESFTYASSNTDVITVSSSGLMTAVSTGNAAITVITSDNLTATCSVEVVASAIPVEGVALKKNTHLISGSSEKLIADIWPANATNPEHTWRSTDSRIVSVDSYGEITANGTGSADITITTQDGNFTSTCEVKVSNEDSFLTSWDTDNIGDTNDNQIRLPLVSDGTYNFTVFWGDGSEDDITSWDDSDKTHTYTEEGTYYVSISGTLNGWSFYADRYTVSDARKLLTIHNWGNLRFGSTERQFYGCRNLTITAEDYPLFSPATSLKGCFYDCIKITTIPVLNSWYIANKTDLSEMFYNAEMFNQDISGWKTLNVTDMSKMFSGCSNFNQNISGWNTSNVTDMSGMFSGCSNFNQNISRWETLNVTDMSDMFSGCSNFNQDISGWETSNVTDMSGMFSGCSNFNQDISGWETSNVTNMSYMFSGGSNFNQNISRWETLNVTNMSGMFSRSKNFNQNISGWNTSNVTNMNHMFSHSESFNQNISWSDTSKVTDMSYMFTYSKSFNQNISGWDTSSVTDMRNMFAYAESFNENISGWNTSSVTTMYEMFLSSNFNQDISEWITSNVTTMYRMFEECDSFNQDISDWDTSNVNNLARMFWDAKMFNQDISDWKTSKVMHLSRVFYGADSFNQDISDWDLSNTTTTKEMFVGSALSDSNYDKLLIGWAASNLNRALEIEVSAKYSASAAAARQALVNAGWTITDGGPQ